MGRRRRWFLLAVAILLVGALAGPAMAKGDRQPRPPRPPRTTTTRAPRTTTTRATTTTTSPGAPQTGTYKWSRSFGGDTWVDNILIGGVAVAPDGASIVAGSFTWNVKIGGTSLRANGDGDIFVARFNPNGNLDWVRQYGAFESDWDYADAVVVDAAGNAYVGGQFKNVATFGTKTLTSQTANPDAYVVKINPAGTVVWARSFGGNGGDAVRALATNGSKIAATGRWTDAKDDVMLAVFNTADGTDVFAPRHEGGSEGDVAKGIAIDAQGATTVTGSFAGRATFAGVTMNSAGWDDMFIARYNASGAPVKALRIGSTGTDVGAAIAPACTGVVLVGNFAATVNFAGISKTARGSIDMFAARFDGDLNPVWVQTYGTDTLLAETMHHVAVDANGNAVFTGDMIGAVNFGTGALPAVGQGQDPFLVKIDADGKTLWAKRFTSTLAPYNSGLGVAIAPGNDIVAVGAFMGDIKIGGATYASPGSVRQSPDGYIARFGP